MNTGAQSASTPELENHNMKTPQRTLVLAQKAMHICRSLLRGRDSLLPAVPGCSGLLAAAQICAHRSVPRWQTSIGAAARIARLGKIYRPGVAR